MGIAEVVSAPASPYGHITLVERGGGGKHCMPRRALSTTEKNSPFSIRATVREASISCFLPWHTRSRTSGGANDGIEVGVFAPAEKGEEPGKPPYLQKHRIRSGQQTITVTLPRKPTSAGIDPNYLLIDLKTDDNIKNVKIES